jgi:hypothetical protein
MDDVKLEKWQKVINNWDQWRESVNETRISIENKYGNIADLQRKSKMEFTNLKEGEIKSIAEITPTGNKEFLILWHVDDEVRENGEKFITEQVGLSSSSYYFYIFLHYWLYSVLPELNPEPSGNIQLPSELLNESNSPLWFNSRINKNGDRIIDSVSWHRGDISFQDIYTILKKKRWPSPEILKSLSREGRPKFSKDLLYPESVVCLLLNKKQKLTQAAVAKLFGWKTHHDTYGNLMSNTVRSRIKLVKKILISSAYKKNTNK